jgi:hypothetical protein
VESSYPNFPGSSGFIVNEYPKLIKTGGVAILESSRRLVNIFEIGHT